MKKTLVVLALFLVSLCAYSKTTLRTGDFFGPNASELPKTVLGWKSESVIIVSEVYMVNDKTAKIVLNHGQISLTYYVSVGDKIYFWYVNNTCMAYAFYKKPWGIKPEVYTIIAIDNNQFTIANDGL